MKKYHLPLITTISTYILIILGILVVGLKAGLACSDWPLCNGRIIPPMEGIIIVEFTHRIFTTVTGLLIVSNAVYLWVKFRDNRQIKILSVLSVLLLGGVAVVGGVNVLNKLPSGMTTIDMALATLLVAVLTALTIRTKHAAGYGIPKRDGKPALHLPSLRLLYKPAMFLSAATYLEIVIGGFFKHSSASYTYVHPDAPYPDKLITHFGTAEFIMYTHMFASFLAVMGIFWLLVYTRKQKVFFGHTISLLALLGVEVFLGFFSLITKLELLTTAAHMAVATLMLCISVAISMNVKLLTNPDTDKEPVQKSRADRTLLTNG